jgi:predicted MFS family arabinose efflux permease
MNVNACDEGTLVLVDEVETGLEPYRISSLINQFRSQFKDHGQIIMTTHSMSAVCECTVNEVCVCNNIAGELKLLRLNKKDAIKGQSLVTTAMTASGIISSLVGGILFDSVGTSTTLLIGAIVSLLGTIIMIMTTQKVN